MLFFVYKLIINKLQFKKFKSLMSENLLILGSALAGLAFLNPTPTDISKIPPPPSIPRSIPDDITKTTPALPTDVVNLLVDVGTTFNIPNFQNISFLKDSTSQRITLLNNLKSLILFLTFKIPQNTGRSFLLSNEKQLIYEFDFNTFCLFLTKILYELKLKKLL